MDNTIITNPGDIIIIKMGIDKQRGFYARVNSVIANAFKKGFWNVRFCPLVPTKDFELMELSWILDDDQIRGQEFTMGGVPHQLFKVNFAEIQNNTFPNLKNDLTKPQKTELRLVVNNPNPEKSDKPKPNLKLIK